MCMQQKPLLLGYLCQKHLKVNGQFKAIERHTNSARS